MKQCPECSAQYDDQVGFCARDGRSLHALSAEPSRLCPHCANSIAEDAARCPYCRADLDPAAPSPDWLIRDESPFETRQRASKKSAASKLVLIAGVALCVIAAALLGMGILGRIESRGTRELLEQKTKELQIKEDHIKTVEAELNKVRLEAADITKEAVALKARLEERQKELAASQQRLSVVSRDLERLSSRRVEPRSAPRPVERATAPSRPAPRAVEPGLYETLRATEVHEQPAQGSRVISRIGGGTRINVVRSAGDWLEVVSRRGNPPGFILRDHARFVGSAN